MGYPIEASCQCGQVTYKLSAPPKKVIACHCRECQKLATSPFSVTAIVSAADIEFSGTMHEWGRLAESGNRNNAKFCSGCGNRIFHFNPEEPDVIKLKLKPVGMIDDTVFAPTMHVWASEKLSWYQIPEGMPTFDKQPGA
ncbi:GFA family protein [Photobacterium ganghwense]|uniref:GFA family protein n=1 Tax=Photobacterium ganghwense TaxID=320778 RepID=UPI0039EE6865